MHKLDNLFEKFQVEGFSNTFRNNLVEGITRNLASGENILQILECKELDGPFFLIATDYGILMLAISDGPKFKIRKISYVDIELLPKIAKGDRICDLQIRTYYGNFCVSCIEPSNAERFARLVSKLIKEKTESFHMLAHAFSY